MKIPISDIKIGRRYRKDMGNLTPLASSIASIGLLHPIVVNSNHELIAGERRLLACKQVGMKEVPVTVVNIDNIIQAEHDENDDDIRKAFTNSERVAIGKAIEEQLGNRRGDRTDVKSRKNGQPSKNGNISKSSDENIKNTGENDETELVDARPQVESGKKTREIAARKAGFDSDHDYRNAKRVEELGCDDLKEAVNDGMISNYDAAAICSEDADVQQEAVRRVLYGSAKTVKAAVKIILAEREVRAEQDVPVQDCNGINIPDTVREYYDANSLFDEVDVKAKELRSLLQKLDKHPISHFRQRGQLQTYCRTIESAMETERFGFVCPACEGHDGANCNCCDNRRWFKASDIGKVDFKKWRRGK